MTEYRFELYQTPQGYRFRLKDAQDYTIGASPAYHEKSAALAAISILQKEMPAALIEETPT
jgi:uncharacterized protein YegP (UPF0339 family)